MQFYRRVVILCSISLVFIFNTTSVFAQPQLDSLWIVWQDNTQPDTVRLKALDDYGWDGFVYSNADSAIQISKVMFEFAEENGIRKYLAIAKNMEGVAYWSKGDYPNAIKQYEKSLEINEEINNLKGIASALNNIGAVYHNQGHYPKALQYFKKSSKIYNQLGDKHGVGLSYSNLGRIYKEQEDYKNALKYEQLSLEIVEEIDDKLGISISLISIGNIYANQGKIDLGLEYYEKSLIIREDIGDKRGMATAYEMIGSLYLEKGELNTAEMYAYKSLELAKEIKDQRGIAIALYSVGRTNNALKNYHQAVKYCGQALEKLQELALLPQQKKACGCLFNAYKGLKQYKKTLEYLELYIDLGDSLQIVETSMNLQQMEFEKRLFTDSVASVEEQRLVKQAFNEELAAEEKKRNIIISIAVLLLLIAGAYYNRFRYVTKSKKIIEQERDRSDNLLLNILPAEVAEELKEKGESEARDYDDVAVLFTDFQAFTETAEKLSAKELVNELNTCFKEFDNIIMAHKIEKIKTIGDAYMAAGGLHSPRTAESKDVVLAALEMQAFMKTRWEERRAQSLPAFEMRVGIHAGPVVAGIVGIKKFQYDIWGDTVNTAARMESSGEVGKVNISQSTYELLKDDQDFAFEHRGKIKAKGKGEMEMYFVSINNTKEF